MREIADAFADLVLGGRCPGCDAAALGLCRDCSARLRGLRPGPVVRPLPGFPPTWAAGEYDGALRSVLLAAKQRGGLTQLPLLGRLAARSAAGLLGGADPVLPVVLVPVPSVRARVRERGMDLTAALAFRARRELADVGLQATVVRAVRLARVPADQVGLGHDERVANARNAFGWRGRVRGSVVIFDDVVTTGATLTAVAAAVRRGGGDLLGAVTVAQTTKRGNPKAPASRP